MARQKPRRQQAGKPSSKKTRPSASQIILYILSLIIVLSMTIGFVFSMLPTSSRNQSVATPTPLIFATITPTPTPEPTDTSEPTTAEPSPDGTATPQANQ